MSTQEFKRDLGVVYKCLIRVTRIPISDWTSRPVIWWNWKWWGGDHRPQTQLWVKCLYLINRLRRHIKEWLQHLLLCLEVRVIQQFSLLWHHQFYLLPSRCRRDISQKSFLKIMDIKFLNNRLYQKQCLNSHRRLWWKSTFTNAIFRRLLR